MYKKNKNRIKRVLPVLFMVVVLLVPIHVQAATQSTYDEFKNTTLTPVDMVGRYRFNYTGNTNYYQYWLAVSSGAYTKKTYSSDTTNNVSKTRKTAAAKELGLKKGGSGSGKNDPDPSKIINSTSAILSASAGASRIYKAYLVWQTRSADGESKKIALVAPDGTAKAVKATAAYVDRRLCENSWDYKSLYCMYTDVTDFVSGKGYGNYSVCNIPVWDKDGIRGGESMASWELIVIEEGENFPVRALQLQMTSTFDRNKKTLDSEILTMKLNFSQGIKTPTKETDTSGNVLNSVSGQIFFGGSCSGDGKLTETLQFLNDTSGKGKKEIEKSTTGGLSGSSGGTAIDSTTCIRMDLSDFSEQNFYNATQANLSIKSEKWTSFFLFGLAVDVAQPVIRSSQTTTVNSSSSVTVTGRVDNNSTQSKTGFYDGKLTVTLDSALVATSATLICYDAKENETYTVSGNTGGNVVIFDNENIIGRAKGSYLTYTIDCTVDTSQGKTQFNNSHELNGKLFSKDYATGVDMFFTRAASTATPMYALTLVPTEYISKVSASDLSASDMTVTKDYTYGTAVKATAELKNGCEFVKWVRDDGTEITANPYSFTMPNRNMTLTAYGKKVYYSVTLHAGTGIESVSGEGVYTVGQTVTISANTKEGYHWSNWTGNLGNDAGTVLSTDTQTLVFQMPEHDVAATANGEANSYTIHFDPNGGTGHIDDIVTAYDTDVTLPDGAATYKKYTFDGVNVTADVETGAISEEVIFSGRVEEETEQEELFLEEAEVSEETSELMKENTEQEELSFEEAEISEEASELVEEHESIETIGKVENGQNSEFDEALLEAETDGEEVTSEDEMKQAEGIADRTVYSSVFLGWSLYEHKDDLSPQWKTGEVVRNLTADDNGEVTLYAVWDDCPWITAQDLYYSLEQAQNGFITVDEILSHATATDREDGSPILPGTNPATNNPAVNTSFTIPDYQEMEFTNLTRDAAVSENLTVTDSIGNTYQKQIMVYVVDTTPVEIKPKGMTRFISEKYFNSSYENGGLEDNSIWKNNPEYKSVLQSAFDHLKNGTPERTYTFTHQQILEMKEFIRENGIGNTETPDGLQKFYDKFMK